MIILPEIDPVAIALGPFSLGSLSLGPLEVRWYGLAYAVGFILAWWLGRVIARREHSPLTPEDMDDLITWLILGLILGGRLGYALFYNAEHYLAHPFDIIKTWQGGMSFHGGLLGVLGAGWLYGRKKGIAFLDIGDILAPLASPGLFFGRLGNFVNGELWGRPTDGPYGVLFPQAAAGGVPRHASQLYEATLEGLVLFVLVWMYARTPRATGRVGGLFLTGYGAFRFLVEFARQPDTQLGFIALDWMTMGQLLCVPMVIFGLWLLLRPVAPDRP
ncbi:MAG: prolipoprotein diacylglyceryl transferase [Proteobacteria bacterium]|nr:prolipoprotein diacylglyceryl transferase [Pseudomonadota bacterium]MBU1612602.1 prolipoprotein diacylglyceryl transferase [Pseudomonadota bacterium]